MKPLLLTALVCILCACGARNNRTLRKQVATDLTCSEGQVKITTLDKNNHIYLGEACQRRAKYSFVKSEAPMRISEIEGPSPYPTAPGGPPVVVTPSSSSSTPPPPPPPPPPAP
ncbi:MAG: hypothetical protein U0228_17835 [Myxococcaceae bacterium]